jgi:hypothetical protein
MKLATTIALIVMGISASDPGRRAGDRVILSNKSFTD